MTAPRRHRPTLAELDALEATWEAYLLDAEDAEDAFDNLGAAILGVLGRKPRAAYPSLLEIERGAEVPRPTWTVVVKTEARR